jgi:hypothetical protein
VMAHVECQREKDPFDLLSGFVLENGRNVLPNLPRITSNQEMPRRH